ncbi:CapA family protein [Alkalinema pantanalense CENA528]|uniref:CapA family protein n=1 Tax=Alkalinema pantanalense TaxID=1620705 RepID=UPI003D6EB044
MNRCVTLAFVGDIRLGDGMNQDLCWRSCFSFWDGALPIFQRAEAVFANLEGGIEAPKTVLSKVTSEPQNSAPSQLELSALPPAAQLLQVANIQFVSLANHHLLDCSAQQLGKTMQYLDAVQIAYAGAGTTASMAALPVRLNIASHSIGILAYTSQDTHSLHHNGSNDRAPQTSVKPPKSQSYINILELPKIQSLSDRGRTEDCAILSLEQAIEDPSAFISSNGNISHLDNNKSYVELNKKTNNPLINPQVLQNNLARSTLEYVEQAIQDLRDAGVELIILSMHWGPSLEISPSKEFRSWAHRLIDLGVDIIHGHGTHIFQAVEVYRHKLILYNTGDILSDAPIDPRIRNDWSFIFLVDLDRDGIQRLRMVPVHLHYANIELAKHEVFEAICHRMQSLCAEFQTAAVRTQEGLVVDVRHNGKYCLNVL